MDETALESKLDAARAELRALESELPSFVKLRDDNARRVDGARRGKAAPEELAKLVGQLSTARELLAQHEDDIRAAAEFVADRERDLERFRLSERARAIYSEIDDSREVWLREARETLNSFIEAATQLGEARRRLRALHADARELRRRLTLGVSQDRIAEVLGELGITEPQTVRDDPPQEWLLRRSVAVVEDVSVNRGVTLFDDLAGLHQPNLDRLLVRPKSQPATLLREHVARR